MDHSLGGAVPPFRIKSPRLAFVGNPDTTPEIDDSQLEAR